MNEETFIVRDYGFGEHEQHYFPNLSKRFTSVSIANMHKGNA
jgi:hypothetical protein